MNDDIIIKPVKPEGLKKDIQDLKGNLEELTRSLQDTKKNRNWRIPISLQAKARRESKRGKLLCIYFRSNKHMEFKIVKVEGGLLMIDDSPYSFENDAVYIYKRLPVIAVYEWRLLPIGGIAEVYKSLLLGGSESKAAAEKLNITNYATRTIIRGIQHAEVGKDQKKGGLSIGPVWWVVIIGVIAYALGKSMGWV